IHRRTDTAGPSRSSVVDAPSPSARAVTTNLLAPSPAAADHVFKGPPSKNRFPRLAPASQVLQPPFVSCPCSSIIRWPSPNHGSRTIVAAADLQEKEAAGLWRSRSRRVAHFFDQQGSRKHPRRRSVHPLSRPDLQEERNPPPPISSIFSDHPET
ncbi:hypothetical protein PIB30_082076, partial [Stylosanthes scabra]|nr:hypothetical protein [Stylosanthes scabra]